MTSPLSASPYRHMTQANMADALRRAAAMVTDNTWTQYAFFEAPDGTSLLSGQGGQAAKCCAMGALEIAAGEGRAEHIISVLLETGLLFSETNYYSLIDWNDQPDREPAHVRALFHRLADQLDAA